MASPQFDRKNRIVRVRRGRLALINRADKLGMISANVYAVVVEINGKFFIYDSRSNRNWRPSDATLVRLKNTTILSSLLKGNHTNWNKGEALSASGMEYP